MAWLWLNIPLAAVFFGAWSGIPLWMVLRHPSWGPEPGDGHGSGRPEGLEPVPAVEHGRLLVGVTGPART
jgi:hypothetical protein